MLNDLILAAPAADGPSFMNSAGIQAIIVFFGSLILMLVGIKLFLRSDGGDVRKASNTGVVVIIGAVIFAAGAAGSWFAIGSGALGSIFG